MIRRKESRVKLYELQEIPELAKVGLLVYTEPKVRRTLNISQKGQDIISYCFCELLKYYLRSKELIKDEEMKKFHVIRMYGFNKQLYILDGTYIFTKPEERDIRWTYRDLYDDFKTFTRCFLMAKLGLDEEEIETPIEVKDAVGRKIPHEIKVVDVLQSIIFPLPYYEEENEKKKRLIDDHVMSYMPEDWRRDAEITNELYSVIYREGVNKLLNEVISKLRLEEKNLQPSKIVSRIPEKIGWRNARNVFREQLEVYKNLERKIGLILNDRMPLVVTFELDEIYLIPWAFLTIAVKRGKRPSELWEWDENEQLAVKRLEAFLTSLYLSWVYRLYLMIKF